MHVSKKITLYKVVARNDFLFYKPFALRIKPPPQVVLRSLTAAYVEFL